MNKTNILVWGIIIVIIVLAGIQWVQNSKVRETVPIISNSSTTLSTATSSSTDQLIATTTKTTSMNPQSAHTVTIETNKGIIVIETYDTDAPKTVQNFITLAQKGFYNGVIFHRVIEGFMIQGGDPTGTGMGGAGYTIPDELNPNAPSFKNGYVRGVVAMANTGRPNTGGSQFFIMHKDYQLPNTYSIFGKVISGMDVVDAIATTQTGPGDKPVSDIVMKKVTVAAK